MRHSSQVNVWDDHDIIDGFGSYVNEFMNCDVFRGIGGCAHKYYLLFQHHLPPPPSTYTSDAPQTVTQQGDGQGVGVDQNQLVNTYVAEPIREANYILGPKPGPYVAVNSHNIFAKLGARIALLGIDARTERTRHQVNYPETYDLIFGRLSQELGDAQAAGTPFRHVILLLGIPIAYPVSVTCCECVSLDSADRATAASHMAREHLFEPCFGPYQVRQSAVRSRYVGSPSAVIRSYHLSRPQFLSTAYLHLRASPSDAVQRSWRLRPGPRPGS